ncbi:uracil phosphoribosyltransferase [Dokdonella sp.]|uniref:uracil phosphoribosyltransferase n=1 Tax=Dokdonella sp. TaxID=2291710 RepID=UPI00261A5C08|nr:uracil phosphoribosyltransferase [Dokdonella sp.]
MAAAVHVIDHPLVQHKLTLLRKKTTSTAEFRRLLGELSALMAYEVTRDLPLREVAIETPVAATTGRMIDGRKVALIAVLRAGIGLLDGMLTVVPGARVGHVGLYRDERTLRPIEYYLRLPRDMRDRDAIVIDPMLATGHSAIAALDRVAASRPRSLRFVCLVSAPEGLANLRERHPDVPIFTAAIDERLNEHGYIVPGLGDAGDRYFGTKA